MAMMVLCLRADGDGAGRNERRCGKAGGGLGRDSADACADQAG
jgi:hypothetical protein